MLLAARLQIDLFVLCAFLCCVAYFKILNTWQIFTKFCTNNGRGHFNAFLFLISYAQ